MAKWITLERGIRYWVHPDRKFKSGSINKRDRYFSIRFTVRGQSVETGIGWESEGTTIDDCRERLRQFKSNAKAGNGQPVMMRELFSEDAAKQRQNITVKDFIESHYLPYSKGVKTPGQHKKESEHCNKWIIQTIGDRRLKDLEIHTGTELLLILKNKMLDAGKSNRMIEYVFFTVTQLFKHGIKMGIVSGKLDMADVKKNLVINNTRQRFLTRDESESLLQLIRGRDSTLADMVEFSLLTGCRQGELFGMQWQDVSLKTKSVLLRDTKNKHDRNLYLTERACEIIQKQPAGSQQDAVFRDKTGKPYGYLPSAWATTLSESGLNSGITDSRLKVVWHTLRHTAASWLAIAGVDLFMIAKVLGHRDLRMTQRYSHLSEQSIRDAVERTMGVQA
jgi:integrase